MRASTASFATAAKAMPATAGQAHLVMARIRVRGLSWTSGMHACWRDRNPNGAAASAALRAGSEAGSKLISFSLNALPMPPFGAKRTVEKSRRIFALRGQRTSLSGF